jgi:integrase/recombinase XerC
MKQLALPPATRGDDPERGEMPTPLIGSHGGRDARPALGLVPLRPFQAPSLDHLRLRVESVCEDALGLEELSPATVARWKVAANSFCTFLTREQLADRFLSGDMEEQIRILQVWIGWLRAKGILRTSRTSYWHALSALFERLARSSGSVNPLRLLRPPRARLPLPRYLTRERAEDMLRRVQHYPWRSELERSRNLCLAGLLMLAGLRRGEALALGYADIDLATGAILVKRGKGTLGGRARHAFMTPQLGEIVSRYLSERAKAKRTHPELLTSVDGNRALGLGTVRAVFDLLSREMGVRVTPHALRHTYATLLHESGVSPRDMMDLLGHRSLAMTYRYTHVDARQVAASAAKLRLDLDLTRPGDRVFLQRGA